MDERSRNEVSPQLLELIPNEREWHIYNKSEGKSSEERKLELRLGPPGGEEDWSLHDKTKNLNGERDESLLSLGYFPHHATNKNNNNGFCTKGSSFLHQFPSSSSSPQGNSMPVMGKDASQAACCTKVVDLQNADKKVFSPSSANTAVPNTSQKRYYHNPPPFFYLCIYVL